MRRVLLLLTTLSGCCRPPEPARVSVVIEDPGPPPDAAPAAPAAAPLETGPRAYPRCCELIHQCEASYPNQYEYGKCINIVASIDGCEPVVKSLSRDVDLCAALHL